MANYDFTYIGAEIQAILDTAKKLKDSGYIFLGVATPSTNPGTPTQKVYYEAKQAGTYTNFGGVVLPDGISLLIWNGSWTSETVMCGDGGAFDISVYKSSGGTLATFADLSAALDGGNNIPVGVRKGGMSVKFVQSSDNKYIRCNLIADEFTTDVTKWAIVDEGVYIDNPEFVYVKTDREGRILWAIKTDGSIYYGAGVPQQVIDYIEEKIGNLHIDEIIERIPFIIDSYEFLQLTLDDEDKIIEAVKKDGSKYIGGNIEVDGAVISDKILLGGKEVSSMATVDVQSIKEDQEDRLEMLLDDEDKIVSYRNKDGILHENAGIETDNANINHLNLTDTGMTEFLRALKDAGFQPGGAGDWSGKSSMYIPEPRIAHLNIITNFNLVNLTKTSDVKCQVEFFDGAGNYFKKWIILNGQGRSSLQFMKKGLGADFFNEDPNGADFDEDNVFSMKFGDWVPQDSFHIKSYYTDFPRCTSPVVYKLTDEVVRTRGVMKDRPYKKYYVGEYSDAANANTQSDLGNNMETGARCFPDGFPVIVYQNGEFWGVNSWQLKKHRDNYQQSKKKATHIHLDGDMGSHNGSTPFWLWNGTIDWSIYCSGTYGIETRNPKNLYCVDGKKYDADTHDAEIITTATAEEWIAAGKIIPTDKPIDDTLAGYLRTTGKVRASIEELTTYVPTINQMISDGATAEEIRATIEDMFDINSFIDYIVIGNVCGNNDAWDNNGQIVTWGKLEGSDRLNWSVNMYDCDVTFGNRWDGISVSAANNTKLGSTYPLYKIFWDYYYDELKARYHELRDKGVFDADHITQLFRSWMDRVGYDNYTKEYDKWDESPCFRDGSQTYVNFPTTGGFYGSIERIYLWIKKRIQYMDAADFFDYNN